MSASVNRVILIGQVGKYGVTLNYAPSGAACASFSLVLTEQTQEGRYFSTLVPCECWGKKAEAASDLDPGQLCLFEGKLARRKKGEKEWELVVSGFELTPVLPSTPALTGHPN